MEKGGEEEVEYESDPEEEKPFLGRRRREAASDDEESEGEEKHLMGRRVAIDSDESEGEGAAAEYVDDEEDEQGVYDDEEEEEEVYVDKGEEVGGDVEEKERDGRRGGSDFGSGNGASGVEAIERRGGVTEEEMAEDGIGEAGRKGKKESEPFSVPTAGAFFMHDDRFRDNARSRRRHTFDGRKLWELKDDSKWGHDKFEEMSMQERLYEQGQRGLKGNYQGHEGKNRVLDKGYIRRSRSKAFSTDENQKPFQKTLRGRGPRKCEGAKRNSSQPRPTQDKQHGKAFEKASHSNSGRTSAPISSTEAPPARKHSSLNSASPPFYPSSSSNKDTVATQKRDVQVGSTSRNYHVSGGDESLSIRQVGSVMRGKNPVDSVAIDKLYINDSVNPVDGKVLNNMQMTSGGTSLGSAIQTSQSRAQIRDVPISLPMAYQSVPIHNQVNRGSATQMHAVQRNPSQSCIQHPVQAPSQQLGQKAGSGSQGSPPKTPTSMNSYDTTESDSTSESNKSKTALVGKGKSTVQSNGTGFSYGGTQVMGSMGNVSVGNGDQNFPAFLPVMQFGGQGRGGMTVPALGMAFPGYVAQPQLGVGNSEMTWLPVLTGAAGALGATYCPPYIAVDGAYHAHASGQPSFSSSSKENSKSRPNNEWQPSQRLEISSDDPGQRQKPRRYSEMDFKQPSKSS